jgi:hypothetical protein
LSDAQPRKNRGAVTHSGAVHWERDS